MDSLVESVLGIENPKVCYVVLFKSNPGFYEKEERGTKPNTTREIDEKDERFIHLRNGLAKYIRVENTDTGQSFLREITDVSEFKGWMIISWKHKVV